MKNNIAAFACLLAMMLACANSQTTVSPNVSISHEVDRVVVVPTGDGGVFSGALTVALFSAGVDAADLTAEYLSGLNATAPQETEARSLDRAYTVSESEHSTLMDKGFDAVVSCTGQLGYDGAPSVAACRLSSTHTGDIIGTIQWKNGSAGAAGSPADQAQRKDMNEAANEIAVAIKDMIQE